MGFRLHQLSSAIKRAPAVGVSNGGGLTTKNWEGENMLAVVLRRRIAVENGEGAV